MACVGVLLGIPAVSGAGPEFDCVMNPSSIVQVAASASGILDEILAARGDVVSQGQPVARLVTDLVEIDLEITGLKASNRAAVKTAETAVSQAKREFERIDQLVRRNAVPATRQEEAKAQLRIAEGTLDQALIEHRLAALAHAKAKSALDLRTIRSPINGFIVDVVHSAGEFLRQDGFVATVASIDPLNVETFLPVSLFPEISVGMTATVRPDPPLSGVYTARITVVDRIFDATSGSFGVRLELSNPGRELPGGHRCKVRFGASHPGLKAD